MTCATWEDTDMLSNEITPSPDTPILRTAGLRQFSFSSKPS